MTAQGDSTDIATADLASSKIAPLIEYLDSLDGRADLEVLERLLAELDVTETDIRPACQFADECYQRNRIRQTAWYELVAICWKSGQRSPIHDHKGSSCAFKVIRGTGAETRFTKTNSGLILPTETVDLPPGYICASADADVHQVANAQPEGERLITLHIYSPPLRQFRKYSLDTPGVEGQTVEQSLKCAGPDTQLAGGE